MSRIKGCEEGARAVPKKSGRTNELGGVVPEEAALKLAQKEDAVGAQVMPGGGKVWQGNAPVRMFLIDMALITEAIWIVGGFCEVPLVELTFTFPLMVSSTTTKITKTMEFPYHIYIGTSSQTN